MAEYVVSGIPSFSDSIAISLSSNSERLSEKWDQTGVSEKRKRDLGGGFSPKEQNAKAVVWASVRGKDRTFVLKNKCNCV